MELTLSPEQQARLTQIASLKRMDPKDLVADIVSSYLNRNESVAAPEGQEVDARGVKLPTRQLVGGIITPQ